MDIENRFRQLQIYSDLLDKLIEDVAQFESRHPMDCLQSIEFEVDKLLVEHANCGLNVNSAECPEANIASPTDHPSVADVESMAVICQKKLKACRQKYEPYCEKAEKIARKLMKEFRDIYTVMRNYFTSGEFCYDKKGTRLVFRHAGLSLFTHYVSDQMNTWQAIRTDLPRLYQLSGGEKNAHNALTNLLNPNNTEFIDAIEYGPLGLHDEIGQLAILRLRDLYFSPVKIEKVSAYKLLHRYLSLQVKDAPLYIDFKALEIEILKLAFFALMHPDNKVIWLGTSRAVNAMIKHHTGDAIYLNPEPAKLNWQLNKAWLLAARTLGYQFELVEQHFPNIEAAILTRNPALFLEELIKEMRPPVLVSQYNGSDAPTSTTQEVLFLLSAGCDVSKQTNGRMRLSPRTSFEAPAKAHHGRFSKAHSYSFFPTSSPPPLEQRLHHFLPPGQENASPPLLLPLNDNEDRERTSFLRLC
ncbi:hypothetical protein GH742_05450 [Legionella sp. MW5194]|uniref:hypothetical protein n=1 Tax=Legionella sp. MW5194 TaxID=2662448 RepID=UPI00193CE052|nr:hypothetical protein [Legionella sp. MW5194]QRN03355.1 hypothetical protein GH742_05450 [Legionella sp. MW5194]